MIDGRLVFDTIPEQFDKWRVKYCRELFDYIKKECKLDNKKKCLEIGPGTGQATEFAIETGCKYYAIELGSNLADTLRKKYGKYENFNVINADFETYPFEENQFDLVYAAAAIQWINQETAYKKAFSILNNGGYFAMFFMLGDYEKSNPDLYRDIQNVYDMHFVTDMPYKRKFDYEIGEKFGFSYLGRYEFYGKRCYSADEYVEYIQTHSDHIAIKECNREPFFNSIHDAILRNGNNVTFEDTYVLYLYQKPIDC